MTDLTPVLNELLKGHDARPTANPALTLQNIDEFLKEAYKIVGNSRKDFVLPLTFQFRMRILLHSTPTSKEFDNPTFLLPPLLGETTPETNKPT